jgi:hypothetical protein
MELLGLGESRREKRLVMTAVELARLFPTLELQGWLSGSNLTNVTPEAQRSETLTLLTELWGIARSDTPEDVTVTIPDEELRRTVIGALVGTSQEHSSDLCQRGEASALALQIAHYMREVVLEQAENVAEITILLSPEST